MVSTFHSDNSVAIATISAWRADDDRSGTHSAMRYRPDIDGLRRGRSRGRHVPRLPWAPGVVVYDPTSLICDAAVCRFESTDVLLYRDSNHLTMTGSEHVAADLLAWLSRRSAEPIDRSSTR